MIALCATSTLLAKIAFKYIWRSVTYLPEASECDEEAKTLSPRLFTFISELEIEPITHLNQCPHIGAERGPYPNGSHTDGRYEILVQGVLDFVARLDEGKLRAFQYLPPAATQTQYENFTDNGIAGLGHPASPRSS